MSISQRWDERDRSIINCEIVGSWTWEEFHEAFSEIRRLALDVRSRVDLVIDMHEAGPLPMSAASLHIKSSFDRMPDNFGVMIMATPDNYIRMLVESLERVLPMVSGRLYVAETANSARRMIYMLRGAQEDDGLDATTRPVIPKFLSDSDEDATSST